MLRKIIGMIVVATLFVACQSLKSKLSEQITLLEKEISSNYDVEKMEKLSSLYREYLNKYPQDNLVEEYLFRSGTLNLTLRRGGEALSDFTTFIEKFSQSPHIADAYYYKAFVYEDIIYEIEAARIAYKEFIERYPNHHFVPDAKLSIKYLGVLPEEIVASFEKKEDNFPAEE